MLLKQRVKKYLSTGIVKYHKLILRDGRVVHRIFIWKYPYTPYVLSIHPDRPELVGMRGLKIGGYRISFGIA